MPLHRPYGKSRYVQGRWSLLLRNTAMFDLESLKIDLGGLKEGETCLEYSLGDDYFAALDGAEITRGNVSAAINIDRAGDIYRISVHTEGTVVVPCDRCLDDMDQEVCADNTLTARLGERFSEDDDLITVGRDDTLLDVSWYIYEFIALCIPIKHVHAPGKCNPAMIKVLEEHSAARSSDGDEEAPVDSRWSELEKLKNKIKD